MPLITDEFTAKKIQNKKNCFEIVDSQQNIDHKSILDLFISSKIYHPEICLFTFYFCQAAVSV